MLNLPAFRALLQFLVILVIPSFSAYAGTISLQTQSTVKVTNMGEEIVLEADFNIKNLGDDSALAVYPSLEKNTWQWRGKPKTINPNETKNWKLQKKISLESLQCAAECLGLDLPVSGSIPLASFTFYKDQSQQDYTSAQILEIKVPPLPQSSNQPQIEWGSIDSIIDGNSLDFEVQGRVSKGKVEKILMRVFSSKHLKAKDEEQIIEVDEDGVIIGHNIVTDALNRANGKYPIFVVLEWEAGGFRESKILSTMFATDLIGSEKGETSVSAISVEGFPRFLFLSVAYILFTGLITYFMVFFGRSAEQQELE